MRKNRRKYGPGNRDGEQRSSDGIYNPHPRGFHSGGGFKRQVCRSAGFRDEVLINV